MPSRLFPLPTLVLALLGLSACDGSTYRSSGGPWAHGDAAFTPQDLPGARNAGQRVVVSK